MKTPAIIALYLAIGIFNGAYRENHCPAHMGASCGMQVYVATVGWPIDLLWRFALQVTK